MPKVDIHNPGKAPRVIHGGDDDKAEIRIGPAGTPGDTVRGVEISDSEVARLKKLAEDSPAGTELLIRETGRVEPLSAGRKDADDDGEGRSKIGTASFKKS